MSIIRFLKDWTLPVSMATGTLLYLLFAGLPALDGAANFFSPILAALFPVVMFMVLFVTFCKVDFRKMRPVRWHVRIALFQLLMVALTTAAILFFHMEGNGLILVEAVLTCMICPCAAAAPVVTVKLGGSLENMTTYTFISNFLTALLIPVVFPLVDSSIELSFMESFLLILRRVCIILLGPMILAYIVKHHLPWLHGRILAVKDLSFYLWAVCLSIVTGTTVRNIAHAHTSALFLLLVAMSSLVLCLLQFYIGRKAGRGMNAVVECGQALGQKNTAFAIWISSSYLNPLSSVGPGCYILWQNTVNSIELWQHQKKGKGRNSR